MKTITLDQPEIVYLMHKDKRLAKVISRIGPIECHEHLDGYSFIIEEIVGQMLSNKVSKILNNRLKQLCDGSVSTESISMLAEEDLRGIGLSNAKAQYIIGFNNVILSKELNLNSLTELDDETVMKTLMSVRGIGIWTAKMYLLFVLNREDILPVEDGAFLQSYKWLYETNDITPKSIKNRCDIWKPYSSFAARYMYRALDLGLTKTPLV